MFKKKSKKLYIAKKNNEYLVKGAINKYKFDGKGQPMKFNEKDAMILSMFFDYELEEVASD